MGLLQTGHENQETTSQAELAEEARKIRRLQIMMNMVISVISQDPKMTLEEASEMAADARRAALAMFPGKELAYDLIYRPRLQRICTLSNTARTRPSMELITSTGFVSGRGQWPGS
jgi:hypothetical protein